MQNKTKVYFTNELGNLILIEVTNVGTGEVNCRVIGPTSEIESILTYEEACQLRLCLERVGC